MKDSEDNSRLEFVKYWRKLRNTLDKLREENPPIYKGKVEQFKDWPSFDGDDMSAHLVDIWDYPAWDKIDTWLNKEFAKSKNDLLEGITPYQGPDLVELEDK